MGRARRPLLRGWRLGRDGAPGLGASLLLATCLLPASACPSRPAPAAAGGAAGGETVAPAPEAPPGPGPAAASGEAGEPRPPRAPGILLSATAVEPTQRLSLAPGAETVVDPGATFEVVLSARVSDARLVLLDAQDALLPARGTREVGPRTTLTLAPTSPLVPGARYALRLEGASERALHDATGASFEPLSLALLAAGTPPPPVPKRRSRRRR